MARMIFDLTEEDREALERLRSARGLRSSAEALRALIRENTDGGEITLGVVKTTMSDRVLDLGVGEAPNPQRIRGIIEKPAAKAFRPHPKPGAKK